MFRLTIGTPHYQASANMLPFNKSTKTGSSSSSSSVKYPVVTFLPFCFLCALDPPVIITKLAFYQPNLRTIPVLVLLNPPVE